MFSILCRELGPQRKPPNKFDLVTFTSTPDFLDCQKTEVKPCRHNMPYTKDAFLVQN
eukprot:Pgem_evm1s3708